VATRSRARLRHSDLAFAVSGHRSYLKHSKRLGKHFAEDLLPTGARPNAAFSCCGVVTTANHLRGSCSKGGDCTDDTVTVGKSLSLCIARSPTLRQGFAYLDSLSAQLLLAGNWKHFGFAEMHECLGFDKLKLIGSG
jgi:hypothetical protein